MLLESCGSGRLRPTGCYVVEVHHSAPSETRATAVPVPRDFIDTLVPQLHAASLKVFLVLCRDIAASATGECVLGIPDLCTRTSLKRRAVLGALAELAALHQITRLRK